MSYKFLKEEINILEEKCNELSIITTSQKIIISIKRQKLYLLNKDNLANSFNISTSKKPPSCIENSFGTPIGLHKVIEKIGDGLENGIIFKSRKSQNYTYQKRPFTKKNLITSRIIRLIGCDPNLNMGINQDTYNRYIYLHGTNHENKIGSPFTDGCIAMSNSDIIKLHELIKVNDIIWIF